MFVTHMINKDSLSLIYKEFLQKDKKEANNQKKNVQRVRTSMSQKRNSK